MSDDKFGRDHDDDNGNRLDDSELDARRDLEPLDDLVEFELTDDEDDDYSDEFDEFDEFEDDDDLDYFDDDAEPEDEEPDNEPAQPQPGLAEAATMSATLARPATAGLSAPAREVPAPPPPPEEPGAPMTGRRAKDWEDNTDDGAGVPWALVGAGVLALVLVAAGGYGVMQDRAQMQEEIRQLQANLATAASPDELLESRERLRELESSNSQLAQRLREKETENNLLRRSSRALEAKLGELSDAVDATQAQAARVQARPAPVAAAAAPRPAAAKATASTAVTGPTWFVNFGSYGVEAIAREWAGKLEVSAGKVGINEIQRNGRTLFRLRISGLANQAQAQQVAAELQRAHDLPKLWVGRE